jgi:hypothetical protein
MTEFDPQSFENELRQLQPAQPSEELRSRLRDLKSSPCARVESGSSLASSVRACLARFWWIAGAAAALVVTLAVIDRHPAPPVKKNPLPPLARTTKTTRKAAHVEINQQLLSAFDAIASLPGGEPVRFHCREWRDEVVLRDSVQGVVIERQMPRLEVVPVRFETY